MDDEKDLAYALSKMNIPADRKDHTKIENLRWLLRNLQVENATHPLFSETMLMLKRLLRFER
jgi:hypothetical protein